MFKPVSARRLRNTSFAMFGATMLFGATIAAPSSMAALAAGARQTTPTSSVCSSPSSRLGVSGGIGGIQWGRRAGSGATCAGTQPAGGAKPTTPPSPSYRGSPPLNFHGGPVVGTTTPGELTVTPVYWVPSGGSYSIPAGYESTINKFIADAAADSGKSINVFSTVTQYTNSGGTNVKYLLHTGTPITDTDAFPTNGCSPDAGHIWSDGTTYSKCITNSQLLSEASTFTTAHGLPNSDLAHLYMYFLPKGVETCFTSTNGAGGGSCSINANPGFCGYHAFGAPPLVADMNYAVVDSPLGWTCSSDAGSNTGGNQTPNGNIDADTEISITSHEVSETITDPEGTAWWDSSGNEIGDDCAYIFGDSLSFQGSGGALYNQTINGDHYFTQTELSNQDFAANSAFSCLESEDSVTIAPGAGAPSASVTASGGGFASGETVKVSYKTGLVSPASVALCTATASGTGGYSCSGHIPSAATAGALGSHKIVAKGATSFRKAKTTFTLT